MIILLCTVLNDEQSALVERIFRENHSFFLKISFRIVESREIAEDVVSTAFIKIMDNIEKISALSCPQMTAFCVTIVKNASIDALRKSRKSVPVESPDGILSDSAYDVEDECIHNADAKKMAGLIDRLDPYEKHFIYLRYTQEMGYKEIAELMNVSEEAAKKRGQRLIKKLRTLYEES